MKSQECQDDSCLLQRPFTNEQVMDKALEQFEAHFSDEAKKAKAGWNKAINEGDCEENWQDFKQFWKEEINNFSCLTQRKVHEVARSDDLASQVMTMSTHTMMMVCTSFKSGLQIFSSGVQIFASAGHRSFCISF